jgi:hypothetical protein
VGVWVNGIFGIGKRANEISWAFEI